MTTPSKKVSKGRQSKISVQSNQDVQQQYISEKRKQYIIFENNEMKLIDSPFIHTSKRSRYDLPYKYPQYRPKQPKPQVKRPPPPRPLIRTYPTYKERIQMMERGTYLKQAPPKIGVFKRSEDNPDLLIVDDTGHTTITFPNRDQMGQQFMRRPCGYQIGTCDKNRYISHFSGFDMTGYFQPRIINSSAEFTHPPSYSKHSFIPNIHPQQFQRYQNPYMNRFRPTFHRGPQVYQQTITLPASTARAIYSGYKCSTDSIGTGAITVRYEPAKSLQGEIFDNSTEDKFLHRDPFLNVRMNDGQDEFDNDDVEFDMMGLDNDPEELKSEECDDLDDINPTITPFAEGIEQYLPQEGQPYVMIPVDIDVAKKLGWPIHMMSSMPKWLSNITGENSDSNEQEVSSSRDNFLDDSFSRDVESLYSEHYDVLSNFDLREETDNAVNILQDEMSHLDDQTMEFLESDIVASSSEMKYETHNAFPSIYSSTQTNFPTATGDKSECESSKYKNYDSVTPDARGDNAIRFFTSTPKQSPKKKNVEDCLIGSPIGKITPTCGMIPIEGSESKEVSKPESKEGKTEVVSSTSNKAFCTPKLKRCLVTLEQLLENDEESDDDEFAVCKKVKVSPLLSKCGDDIERNMTTKSKYKMCANEILTSKMNTIVNKADTDLDSKDE